MVLRPGTPSDGRYAFAVERLDPFVARDDMEPNDDEWAARPMPTSGFVRGSGALPSDQDWFVLPASADGTPVTVVLEGEDARPMMSDWVSNIPMTAAEDGRTWTSDPVPMHVPLFLGVESSGDGPYTLTLAGGAESAPVGDAPFDITLDATEPAVAAYWPEAQRVSVMLHIRPVTPGSGGASQLTIDARTSNEDWLMELGAATVTLDGTDVESPIVIQVPADAWADDPVRVTVRVRDAEGRSRDGIRGHHAGSCRAPGGTGAGVVGAGAPAGRCRRGSDGTGCHAR